MRSGSIIANEVHLRRKKLFLLQKKKRKSQDGGGHHSPCSDVIFSLMPTAALSAWKGIVSLFFTMGFL